MVISAQWVLLAPMDKAIALNSQRGPCNMGYSDLQSLQVFGIHMTERRYFVSSPQAPKAFSAQAPSTNDWALS